ncbi:MAG: hypothetical protein WC219_03425 [Acholeplasmataceae bacterium]
MKVSIIKKITLFLMIFSALLYVGTFLRFDKVFGNPYDQYYTWNGFDLAYEPMNPTAINFESEYVPFSNIMDIADASQIDVDKKYVIESAFELYRFSVLAGGADDDIYLSLDYVLGQDIDYYQALQMSIENLFIPIGFNQPFTGTFDGQGYEITNLIFRPTNTVEEYDTYMPGLIYLSMFSKISTTGEVKNFGLINPLIIQALEQGVMTHVSVIAGENRGLVENVYYIDLREDSAGINAEGNFFISGLVSRNIGTLKNSYISTPYVKSMAISSNLSTNVLVYDNQGVIDNIYYDEDVLLDEDALKTIGLGLTTLEFQNPLIFNSKWYFPASYLSLAETESLETQFLLDHTYPILQGLDIENNTLLINDAVDLVYMNTLFGVSGQFRAQDYVITHDIDMNQVSKTAYKASSTGFNGSLSSKEITSSQTTLYDRNTSQGGDITHHTIIDLKIEQATFIGNYASYAIFSSLFGSVYDLNIYNLQIQTNDIDLTFERTKVLVGSIAGQTNHATIDNVHVDIDAHVNESSENLGQILLGGIAGEGSAQMLNVTTNGQLSSGHQVFNDKSNHSAIAGIIAKSSDLVLEQIVSNIEVFGLSYQSTFQGTTYAAGIVGYGAANYMHKVVNLGNITAFDGGNVNQLYVAGMFAYMTDIYEDVTYVYNQGNIDLLMDQNAEVYVNGVGYFSDLEDNLEFNSITNNGYLNIDSMSSLNQTILENINIYASGVLTIDDSNTNAYGIYLTKNQDIDLSIIDTYSGILTNLGTKTIDITKAYSESNLILTSQQLLTNVEVKISGLILGENINMIHLRNEGNIAVNMNHQSVTFANGRLFVFGMFEKVSLDHQAKEIIQLGNIDVIHNQSGSVSYNVYISGISGYNEDINIYNQLDYQHDSINITDESSSFDTVLNKGNITFTGAVNGHVRIAGIVMFNRSLLTNAINLGDLYARNDVVTANDEVEVAGIAYLMSGAFAQLKDTANNGEIKAISNTNNGYAHASGIALRNDRLENGNNITPNATTNYNAKVLFSINYGDIYAYNGLNESNYDIEDETRSKAAGIIAIGVMSGINNANYGNVYSRYLAAGIIGLVDYAGFGAIPTSPKRVFISNSINYGLVRNISSYDANNDSFQISSSLSASLPYQLGAIVAKFHTGTDEWNFIGSNAAHPINAIYFGYLLNFDESLNMFGKAPAPQATNFNSSEELFNLFSEEMSDMMNNMATINPNDQSTAPFRQFNITVYFFGWGIPRAFSRQITSYTLSDLEDGIFYEGFGFRYSRPVFGSTDQYIRDYVQYIPNEKVNDHLLNKINQNVSGSYPGIYALSSSKGIGNGIFIPDNFETEGLNKFDIDHPLGDNSWIDDDSIGDSVSYQLYTEMRQIENAFATTIYDLEIQQVYSNGITVADGLTLKNPIIDNEKGLLTYYIPSNAKPIKDLEPSFITAKRFIEVTQDGGMVQADFGARYVPNEVGSGEQTYKWVGTHRLNTQTNLMEEIGPYAMVSDRVYNITSIGSYGTSTRLFSAPTPPRYQFDQAPDAVGDNVINQIADFAGYSGTIIVSMTGYQVSYQEVNKTQNPGGGAYKLVRSVTFPNYSTNVLVYVGPSTELYTYVETGLIEDVVVYPEADVYFLANTEEDTYAISDGATLEVLWTKPGQTTFDPKATIPLSYGIYTQFFDEYGAPIDSVEDHYGEVRVKSQAYNPNDSSTYKDYQIRVIRTANQEITDVLGLTVNGIDALPNTFDVSSLTAQIDLGYQVSGSEGVLSVTYETYNFADEYYIEPLIEIFDHTGVKVHSSYYDLQRGYVEVDGGFENATGEWGYGSVSVDLVPGKSFPSGDYSMVTTLVTDISYTIYFTKLDSGNLAVEQITFNDVTIEPETNILVSEIPYGIYYVEEQPETSIVDFSNLDALENKYYTEIIDYMPNYLQYLEISNFATIIDVDLTISLVEGYRHQYEIVYQIEAENGSLGTFTHRLIEAPLDASVLIAYKNGGELNLPLQTIDIFYEEGPTLRMEYDFEDVYFASEDILSVTSSFIPLNGTDVALENADYFITTMNNIGYEVDLNREIPKGDYEFMLNYHQQVNMWGYNFVWNFDFDTVYATKLKNDNAHLQNILFATNSVFDEVIDAFSTIIEVDPITVSDYESYYVFPIENRTQRIINVLPTTGIDYGSYERNQAYWILGQVQRTNLASYTPTFYVPDGASIYKVVDDTNLHYSYQSAELTADYSDFGDGVNFTFVKYRVYAEDFDENNDHYVDYYVTVQDTTNNVKIDITVVNDTTDFIEEVFVTVNVCRIEEGEVCNIDNYLTSMNLFSYFNQEALEYINLPFATSTDGVYKITADLPEGYDFYIEASQELISGDYLNIPSSRIPQRYFITIHIVDGEVLDRLWGYDESYDYIPAALPLDELKTYVAYERFVYDDITYMVQPGYNYTYSFGMEPGSSPLLGLLNVSKIYDPNSTYISGNTVYYLDTYYKALDVSASGVTPDLTSVSNGLWFELSPNWLSYNHYETGDVIYYSGNYYIALMDHQGYTPDVSPSVWDLYIE